MTTKNLNSDTARTISYQELESLFQPQSIAVVGASANQRVRGHGFVKDLIDFGFPGPIYPVNPTLDEMLGLKAYHRLEDIPGPVDYVISAVPASAILDLVEGARAKGVKLLHLFTARFSETGRQEEHAGPRGQVVERGPETLREVAGVEAHRTGQVADHVPAADAHREAMDAVGKGQEHHQQRLGRGEVEHRVPGAPAAEDLAFAEEGERDLRV